MNQRGRFFFVQNEPTGTVLPLDLICPRAVRVHCGSSPNEQEASPTIQNERTRTVPAYSPSPQVVDQFGRRTIRSSTTGLGWSIGPNEVCVEHAGVGPAMSQGVVGWVWKRSAPSSRSTSRSHEGLRWATGRPVRGVRGQVLAGVLPRRQATDDRPPLIFGAARRRDPMAPPTSGGSGCHPHVSHPQLAFRK